MLEGTKNFRTKSMLRKQNAKDGYSFKFFLVLKFCLGRDSRRLKTEKMLRATGLSPEPCGAMTTATFYI